MGFFVYIEIDKLTLKFIWTFKISRRAKTTLEIGRLTLPDFKNYY